jgi:parvulin-like peptidyl-prolyl isomerase
VLAELEGGAKFEDLAKKYSTDPGSKDNGGKYTAVKGQSVPEFEKAAYALKTNEVSAPVKTQFGFHIIQALGAMKKATTTPFADVKASIKATLEQERKNEVASKWAEDLKVKYLEKTSYASGFAPPDEATAPVEDDTEN